jgi:hypothetical protein
MLLSQLARLVGRRLRRIAGADPDWAIRVPLVTLAVAAALALVLSRIRSP